MNARRSPAPRGLGAAGKRLWVSVVDEFDLAVHEQLMLTESCRVVDRLDLLAAASVGAPLTVTNAKGDEVANPLFTEARQQQIVLMRLLASMRMPDADEEGQDVRPQRRGAARKPYRPRPLSAVR